MGVHKDPDKVSVPGSHRAPLHGARVEGETEPGHRIEVVVLLRPRTQDEEWERRVETLSARGPLERVYLSREELADARGAHPDDVSRVEAFAAAHRLEVVDKDPVMRIIRLAGTVADLSAAFGTRLQRYVAGDVSYRGRTGVVTVPASLDGIVAAVLGLDDRPVRRRRASPKVSMRHSDFINVPDVARCYEFPPHLDGSGQCIGLIELNQVDADGKVTGGGYSEDDLSRFFKKIGRSVPRISSVRVGGGRNAPGSALAEDMEVMTDIAIAGATAPGARLVVYFAPNTDAGFIAAVQAAVHDHERHPSVISISWGQSERDATDQFVNGLHEVLKDAAALGITVCCESGDHGSANQPADQQDGSPHVEFPASSPFALACGGTRIESRGASARKEVVWHDAGEGGGATGGGVSVKFPRPAYQASASVPLSPAGHHGRGMPDVAGNAPGYQIFLRGQELPTGGTSAVAPLWAGLIALFNQALGAHRGGHARKTCGFLNPVLYALPPASGAFYDIVEGNNDLHRSLGKYTARPGWDACTGLGAPNGTRLLDALLGSAPARRGG